MNEDMPELLKACDYVCNILPSTTETRGLLSGDILSHCKHKRTVFINLGRGDVIDEASLINAMRQGWLHSAVLDVQPEEPVPEHSLLWNEPNIFISPHVSAVSFPTQVLECFLENYDRYLSGKPLLYEVDLKQGY